MGKLNVAQLAAELNLTVDLLLEQLQAAGGSLTDASAEVSEKDKALLLEHLRHAHGADHTSRKITLTRRETTEIQSSDRSGRARTIQVEVRKHRVVAPRVAGVAQAATAGSCTPVGCSASQGSRYRRTGCASARGQVTGRAGGASGGRVAGQAGAQQAKIGKTGSGGSCSGRSACRADKEGNRCGGRCRSRG